MTRVIRNDKTIFELQENADYEWQDGDDSAIYDEGYYDGILKALEIINSVRNTENVERVPFHLTMSAVASTLREIAKGYGNGMP
jgi:hypothetical protein